LLRTLAERSEGLAIEILEARKIRADRALAGFLEIDERPGSIAHITAVVDPGEPFVCLIDSYSSVARIPWLLPAARALRRGSKPPEAAGVELTRATVSIEGTFFSEWGAELVDVVAGTPALMGRFIQYGRVRGARKERPLEFARLVYRTDSTELAFDLS
jgi:DNA-binding GntR family transcriptional regulator